LEKKFGLEDYFNKGVLYFLMGKSVDAGESLFGVLHLPSIKFLKLFDCLKLEKLVVLLKLFQLELELVNV